MKKTICIILTVLSFMLFTGCDVLKPIISTPDSNIEKNDGKENGSVNKPPDAISQTDSNEANQNAPSLKISDYYPFKENVKYEYEGKGMEYASFKVWVDYIKENRIQLRSNNGGTETIKVIENKNGELKSLFSLEEGYYREDFTSKPANKNEILLKEPLIKGTSWTLPDGRNRYISNVDVQVGNYKTLEVTTEGKEDKVVEYYAPNVGLVKTLFSSKGTEVTSTLSKVTSNSPLVQSIKFFYPNATDSKIYYVIKDISFKTNDITKMSFEKAFKEVPGSNLGKLLGTNAKIKSLYLNKDNMVYVDFTKELVTEMNAGAGYESLILQSIANTLGTYYGTNKVYLTVEGQPYSSGHMEMKKGEAFTVNTKNSVEYRK